MNSVGATRAETDNQGSNDGPPNDQDSGVSCGSKPSHGDPAGKGGSK
jgi:hypothetical protein